MSDPRTLTYDDTATLANADMTASVDPMGRLDALRKCVVSQLLGVAFEWKSLSLARASSTRVSV